MSQEKLAEMCDGGTTHIFHIETGNCISSLQVFKDNELALILAMLRLQETPDSYVSTWRIKDNMKETGGNEVDFGLKAKNNQGYVTNEEFPFY